MILTTTNNETIILIITGYAENHVINDDFIDSNWLYVYVRVVGKKMIEHFHRNLTTWDLLELKNWLSLIAHNEYIAEKRFDFVSQELNLQLLSLENEKINLFSFSSSDFPNKYSFEVSNNELMKIIAALNEEIRFFPERTVESRKIKPIVYHYPLFVQTSIQMEPHDPDAYNLIIQKTGELPTDKAQTPQNLSVSILLSYSVLDSELLQERFFVLERELETILSESFNAILPIAENGFVQYIDFKNHSFVQHFEVVIADKFTKNIQEIYRDKIRINNLELKVINAVDK